jgi:hypothetical protein
MSSPAPKGRFLSTNAVDREYGLRHRVVRELCERGDIEFYRQPGTHARFMIYEPSLVKYLAARGNLPSLAT